MSINSAVSAVSDGLVVAKRNLINIKRVPDLLVFTTLQPIMFVLCSLTCSVARSPFRAATTRSS